MKAKLLGMASAITVAVSAMPVMAQAIQVYTNQSLFDSQRPGITTNTFSFSKGAAGFGGAFLGSTYTQNNVTFSTSGANGLNGLNDGSYGSSSYLANYDGNFNLSVMFAGPVLGLTLGAYGGAETINYSVNGQSGSIALGANRALSFIGFDTGRANSALNVTFSFASEVDILGFQTAVPEASTWAMMIAAIGAVGGMMRRRRRVTTRVAFG